MKRQFGIASNSIILAFVQCFTMLAGIIQTMILSRALSVDEYGTYTQGLLVVGFITPFLLLGLSNAVTYFSGQKNIDKQRYVNTIVSLVFILGMIGALGIIVCSNLLQGYFGNTALNSIIPLIAFLPMFQNIVAVYQTLYIAEEMATSIAIRNTIVAVAQIAIVSIGALIFHDIRVIYSLLIVMNIVQIILFSRIFNNRKYPVRIERIKKEYVQKIYKYSIPLALSTAIGTLSVYMDKLLIGKMMSVEDFALYYNMAKELPLSFVVSSFTTVILPVFIRLHAQDKDNELREAWKNYLNLGLSITWIIGGAAIICSKDLVIFLYSEKYSSGHAIFVVYLVISLLRFSYFGIILSTFGKTKVILYSSLCSLICNFILNIVLFHYMGMIGPAIASVIAIVSMQILQIVWSCKLLKCHIVDVFDIKHIALLCAEMVIVGYPVVLFGQYLSINIAFRLLTCGGLIVASVGMLNYKRIRNMITSINRL